MFLFCESQFERKGAEMICQFIVEAIISAWRLLFTGRVNVLLCGLNLDNNNTIQYSTVMFHY